MSKISDCILCNKEVNEDEDWEALILCHNCKGNPDFLKIKADDDEVIIRVIASNKKKAEKIYDELIQAWAQYTKDKGLLKLKHEFKEVSESNFGNMTGRMKIKIEE